MHKYFPGVDVKKGIASYQEYYTDKGIFELSLYDGIVDTLQNLRAQDYKIAVASSKPEVMIERIVDHLKLRSLFDGAYGASADERTRVSKTDVLRYAMQNMDAEQGSSIMIGDRFTDIEGGKNNDVKTLGVTYGFGDAHELKKAGADIIVDAPVAIDAAAAKLF
jgi:phosphoglycolate phosphatase